ENRNEVTLSGAPFNFELGVDYGVFSSEELAEGVPEGTRVVLLESNSYSILSWLENINQFAAQQSLDNFLEGGGIVVAHMATATDAATFVVPGLAGQAVQGFNSNEMRVPSNLDHPFVWGEDGTPETDDDSTDESIAWLNFNFAHRGILDGVLPPNAEVLLRGLDGAAIYAEYPYGEGRVIVTTLTIEYGLDVLNPETGDHIGYGHRDRMVINHLYHTVGNLDDYDSDGVTTQFDCDDTDRNVGELLFEDDFSNDNGFFDEPAQLSRNPWDFSGGEVAATGPGQQALVGFPQSWGDTVTYAVLAPGQTEGGCAINGSTDGCGDPTTGEINRWRAGILARSELSEQTDEGFVGFRCALASNAEDANGIPNSGPSTGQFLQISSFLDGPEDEISSECEVGPNTTFDELSRVDYEVLDFTCNPLEMTFYAVGNRLHCSVTDGVFEVSTEAWSDTFTAGTAGLSTLNMHGKFDSIRVCRATGTP
ncbi:MAG: hypothetical protein AAGC55_11190, partial [Myxococcota bacterium]